jgi:hypothetical protein
MSGLYGVSTYGSTIYGTDGTSSRYVMRALAAPLVFGSGLLWVWDTANSRLVASANENAVGVVNGLSVADLSIEGVTSRAYLDGVVARYIDISNYYSLLVCDDSGQFPQTMRLMKMVAGVSTLIASVSITFARGTYHIVKLSINGSTFLGSFDGVQLINQNDTDLLAAGQAGIYHGGGASGTAYWYDLAIRPSGVTASGKTVYTRVRLTSNDPLQTPSVPDLLASVRGPDLATGAVIPQTQHAYKDSVAAFLDDVAQQSNLSWRFNESYQLKMLDRLGSFAPFVIATANGNIDGVTRPIVSRFSPLYRNRHYVTGAIDLAAVVEPKVGDGVTQSWVLAYPVDSMQGIMLNGESQSFGIQGTDTGRVFYYQQGSNTLTIDTSLTPPASTFTVTYTGQIPYRAMAENTGQQAIIALLDNSSGIVEMSEDVPGLTRAAADALAAARITQYARLAIDWKFVTQQNGLGPGQLLTVIVPEFGLNDLQFLITDISTTVAADKDGNLLYWYKVTTTTGPSLGNWSRKLQTALLKG